MGGFGYRPAVLGGCRLLTSRSAIQGSVDLPERKAVLFVKLCGQNPFRLSPGKRKAQFEMLSDDGMALLEQATVNAYRLDEAGPREES